MRHTRLAELLRHDVVVTRWETPCDVCSSAQVTFTVLTCPPEHHAVAFIVSTAATGGSVLKLGLGHLMGAPGEIFKILDDPISDRCYLSRYEISKASRFVFIRCELYGIVVCDGRITAAWKRKCHKWYCFVQIGRIALEKMCICH